MWGTRHPPGSEQVSLEGGDEGQAGGDDFVETAVVSEEEVDAGGGGDRKVEGVQRFHAMMGAEFRE